mmetsp:Transcript_16753/g.25319  ORF Transcript_16753/g.25319 Transcript_16753/m.25319 type:complete len:363 (-) Transcript_16753:9-1097(-)
MMKSSHCRSAILLLLSILPHSWPLLGRTPQTSSHQPHRNVLKPVAGRSLLSHDKTVNKLQIWQNFLKKEASDDDEAITDQTIITNNVGEKISINGVYVTLATAETIFWWYLAPGIDPESRWFAPSDGVLLSKLFDPAIVLSPGSGLSFSSLLLNSFLILPAVWSILLLQEDTNERTEEQLVSPWPFCLASFFVGGGSLIPYMIFRKKRPDAVIYYDDLPLILKIFENPETTTAGNIYQQKIAIRGPILLGALAAIILAAFLIPLLSSPDPAVLIAAEYHVFMERLQNSQFTSLALFDFIMISLTITDPMIDDAKRRGYLETGLPWTESVPQMVPFLFPWIGPVSWIYVRPGLPRKDLRTSIK